MAKQFNCTADEFMVRAENVDEVVELVKKHASMHDGGPHDNADDSTIREQIKDV